MCVPESSISRSLLRRHARQHRHRLIDVVDDEIYDPWHYVPVLARKPGALRNGASFKDCPLPASLERVRRRLKGSDDGDRQMVKVLLVSSGSAKGGQRGLHAAVVTKIQRDTSCGTRRDRICGY